MVTPIILLTVLILPFWLATAYYRDMEKSRFAGVAGLSAMFVVAAMGHFFNTGTMMELIPPFLPFPKLAIILTGILELVVAAGLQSDKYMKKFGWFAIFLFVLFLPFNIYGASKGVDLGGHAWGLTYLFLKVPLQFIFIIWTWWFCISNRKYREVDPHINSC